MDKILELLKTIGVGQESIDKIKANPDSIEQDKVISEITTNIRKNALLDTAFTLDIRNKAKAEAYGIVDKKLMKTFGLTKEQIGEKLTDEIVDLARDIYGNQMKETFQGANDKKLQDDLHTAKENNKKLSDELEKFRTEILPSEISKVKQEVDTHITNLELQRTIEKMPLAGSPDVFFPAIKESLTKDGYRMVRDNGKLAIKKLNSDEDVYQNERVLEPEQYITNKLKGWAGLKESNGDPKNRQPARTEPNKPDNNNNGNHQPKRQLPKAAEQNYNSMVKANS